MRRLCALIDDAVARQRGHLFPWLPVGYGIGIGVYFSLRFEPTLLLLGGMAVCAVLAGALAARAGETLAPVLLVIGIAALGFVVAALRTHAIAAPVLDWRYYGPIEGRIVGIDRSASDALRLTLDHVRLDGVAADKTPARVRIALHGDRSLDTDPRPGLHVGTTGHLSAPGGPVEPGGFDFQRHAWFLQLGAVGYSRVPLVALAPPDRDAGLAVLRVRMAVSARVRAVLPGDTGGFAAAVTTGDRSGMSVAAIEAMRASNTAHLLAISGLHMGLLTGFVLGVLRLGLALVPALALNLPTRTIAAGGALAVGAGYLALSGGNVATERAFVMAAVALVALMLDRRAISLRAVAVAALIVLSLRPEALLSPGFQMSFSATTALVAVFNGLRGRGARLPRWLKPVLAVILSSAVAGLATLPVAAAHFNAIAHFGLIANLLSVPLMGVLVIPAAVLAAFLAPFGLEIVGLWPMGLGLRWILAVADQVAATPGARGFVPGPVPAVLPLLSLGALVVILWQGRERWAGVLGVAVALALWTGSERPGVLIAEGGTLVGVMTEDGRALSKARGAGFVAEVWLENDGDAARQEIAAARWPPAEGRVRRIPVGRFEIVHVSGKRAAAEFPGCGRAQIVVTDTDLRAPDCLLVDAHRLQDTGALALSVDKDGAITVRSARGVTGARLWTRWAREDAARTVDGRRNAVFRADQ